MTTRQLTQQLKHVEQILLGIRRMMERPAASKPRPKIWLAKTAGVISRERGEEMLREIKHYRKAPARGRIED